MFVLFLAVFAAGCAAWGFFSRGEMEQGLRKLPSGGTTLLVNPWLLPCYFLFMTFLTPLIARNETNFYKVVGVLIVELALLCVYYALLLCILPLLRRRFSARACATLWVLPNYLYLLGNIYSVDTTSPRLVLTLPKQWLRWIVPVWLAVFVLILLWQIASHLLYRRYLLDEAELVCSKDILPLWHEMQDQCRFKHYIPIVVSPHTHTPLTIGLSFKSMHLVLPHLNYTQDELKLILSHELRHIQRADTQTKAFIGFCTALCWFNPFMWISRRKVSEDLELSCDELVLADADEATRTQYANLLLNTAGSSRGYTTCLSAAASSLRYRLKNVVKPRKLLSGTLLVGLSLGVLTLSMGTIALADHPGTVQTLIFDHSPDAVAINHVHLESKNAGGNPDYYDSDALTEYLSTLPVRPVYFGSYSDDPRHELEVRYDTEENNQTAYRLLIELHDNVLFTYEFNGTGRQAYAVDKEIDWAYIESLVEF